MKFKAILIGALVKPFGKGAPGPWQCYAQTQHVAASMGRAVLDGLPPDERKAAFVRVIEIREIVVEEIRWIPNA